MMLGWIVLDFLCYLSRCGQFERACENNETCSDFNHRDNEPDVCFDRSAFKS